jgi:DNA-binding NarL/FixJ family response regulator
MDPETLAKAVENARKAHYLAMAEKSARVRKARAKKRSQQEFADRQQAILRALSALDEEAGRAP